MPEYEKKKLMEWASLWITKSKGGNEYLQGKAKFDGSKLIGFYKKDTDKDNFPDIKIYMPLDK